MNHELAISVQGLTKDFHVGLAGRKLRAVDNLTLEIPRGQVYGLLGPNGCGKSTTLKIILGLIAATAGKVSILGSPSATRDARRRTGFLPEAPYFHKFLTGRELVSYYARLSGVEEPELKASVEAALALTAMTEAGSRTIATYSKGMLQRIGLAQAIVHQPELVILDEPTAGVDPVGAAAIGKMILEMRAQGKTIVLCSHLLGQVEQVCDRIAIMDKGKLVLEGRVDDILTRQDSHIITTSTMSKEAALAVQSTLLNHGVKEVSLSHPRRSLEELFRERVKGSRDA